MKKKEKKYYGKKKKFYSFFLKIFIPFIVVTSILGGIITAFLNLTFQNNISSNVQAAEKTIRQTGVKYWDIYQTELEEQKDAEYEFQTPYNHYIGNMIYLNNLSMAVLNDSEVVSMQGFIHLYQKDDAGNLTEITDQKDKVFLQINDTSENKYMLYCDNDIFGTAVPEMKDMSADFSFDKMNEVYVSGMQFYPASYTCFADGEEQERTVSEIPDGYVKLDQSSEFTIPHGVVGCIPTSLKVDRYTGTDDIVNDYQNNSNWEYVEDIEKCAYGTHTVYAFPINNDNTAFAVIDYHYNIAKSLMGHMIIYTWLGVVLGSALISLVIAYIMYRSYKSAYDMEQYRRTTSNAMAHDLKSPLAVISLYAENLKSGKNPEKNQYYMEGILNEVKAMNEQVASILDMAKAEDVNTELHKTKVDIGSIINTAAEVYAETIKTKNIRLDIQGSCQIDADETLMYQAVMNMMDNAVKYVTKDGKITVQMSNESLSIQNTSEPIPEDVLKSIWNPFVKGDNSRHGHKGTGLGLSIVKTIMDRHGFTCEMKNAGDGVKVKIRF